MASRDALYSEMIEVLGRIRDGLDVDYKKYAKSLSHVLNIGAIEKAVTESGLGITDYGHGILQRHMAWRNYGLPLRKGDQSYLDLVAYMFWFSLSIILSGLFIEIPATSTVPLLYCDGILLIWMACCHRFLNANYFLTLIELAEFQHRKRPQIPNL